MPVYWNFLNPYMRPLSESFKQGAAHGLQFKQHREDLGERRRQFDAREPYRNALVQQMMQQNAQRTAAQDAYNWAMGGSGQMFTKPYTRESANQMLLNPFITGYLGITGQQPSKPQWDLIRTGPKTKKYVEKGTPGDIPYYEKPDEPDKKTWDLIRTGRKTKRYYEKGTPGDIPFYDEDIEGEGPGGVKGKYTIQQMVDDNLAHYKAEFSQRTANMTDPVSGIPYKEYKDQYAQIQQEIFKRFQEDNYRINQGQRPSWLTGVGDEDQKQKRYFQLMDQYGGDRGKVEQIMRAEGFEG